MSCSDDLDTCGSKTPAKCVSYEGIVNEVSSLQGNNCKTQHKVNEDIYTQLGNILTNLDISNLDFSCFEDLDEESSLKEILQGIISAQCNTESTSGITSTGEIDPCSGEEILEKGHRKYTFATGSFPLSTVLTQGVNNSDMYVNNIFYKAVETGLHKFTKELSAAFTSATAVGGVSMFVNGTQVSTDSSSLEGNFTNSNFRSPDATITMIKELTKDDVVTFQFNALQDNTITINNLKLIVETI